MTFMEICREQKCDRQIDEYICMESLLLCILSNTIGTDWKSYITSQTASASLVSFFVVWYWSTLSISFRVTLLTLGQSQYCPSVSEATLKKPNQNTTTCKQCGQIDGLVQERRNSSALAMELRLSCTNPSISWEVLHIPKSSIMNYKG